MGPCIQTIQTAVDLAIHPPPPDPERFSPTSVMALFMCSQSPSLLFIQKADREGYPWRNHMAFPGGHVDEKDPCARATALRELREEMGIHARNVTVLGSIGHFQTLNNKDIQAFAGFWNESETICFDQNEISRVFKIPLSHLSRVHREKGYAGRTPGIMELTYPFEDVTIWGVTAKIVHHLMEILAAVAR